MAAAVFIVVPMMLIMLVDAGVPFLPEIASGSRLHSSCSSSPQSTHSLVKGENSFFKRIAKTTQTATS
ncbi:unnamed protein product, partial [Mesorhabditis belari]|uniref:Secreted protein n=1 Tax=Mesorhabditis belari TaxID=2138241 RepID=A0AAF3EYJ8_9BILA